MKRSWLAFALLLGISAVGTSSSIIAQNPPAKTYQPGFWQPSARVVVNRPIAIEIINTTDIPIEYNLTTAQATPQVGIEPGKSSIVNGFDLPVYILINPSTVTTVATDFVLKFEVTVDEPSNIAKVKVMKVSEGNPGSRALNIHETGAIYIY